MMPTIGNANDYLERWLASASLDAPYPLEPPPFAETSWPVDVNNISGIYVCQKKFWFPWLVLQTLAFR